MNEQVILYQDQNGKIYYESPTGEKIYVEPTQESTNQDVSNRTYTDNKGRKFTPREIEDQVNKTVRDYLTTSNDATSYNGGRFQNSHLIDRTVLGAKAYSDWRKAHPNLAAWGDFATMVPLATAAYPFATVAGDAMAATKAGTALTQGFNWTVNAAKATPWFMKALPWLDAGLSSLFISHGANEIRKGNFTPTTAMEVLPAVRPLAGIVERVQQLLKSSPLPSYEYKDIINSSFFKNLTKEFGEDSAKRIAVEISKDPQFFIGDGSKHILKLGKRHQKQMEIVKNVEDNGGILGGSAALARSGSVNRQGLMHDLDFVIPSQSTIDNLGTAPYHYGQPKGKLFPRFDQQVIRGYDFDNYPQIKDGLVLDMFVRDRMPATQQENINMILDAKRYFGRQKDLNDLSYYRPYSEENPLINIETGETQWNPSLFERIFTKEGYPFVKLIETYPGSGVRVPAALNFEGKIKLLDRPSLTEVLNAGYQKPWTGRVSLVPRQGFMADTENSPWISQLPFGKNYGDIYYRQTRPIALDFYRKNGTISSFNEEGHQLYQAPRFTRNNPASFEGGKYSPAQNYGDIWIVSKPGANLQWDYVKGGTATPLYKGEYNKAPISEFDFYVYDPNRGYLKLTDDLNIPEGVKGISLSKTPHIDYLNTLSEPEQLEYLQKAGLNKEWLWTLKNNPDHLESNLRGIPLPYERR